MLSSPQLWKSPLWAVMEIVRNGPAKGLGGGDTPAGLPINSRRVLAGAERMGLLQGVLIRVGLIEALPVVFSKNSSGNRAEGKRRGLLQELGGTPHPLPLPAKPCVRKCRGVRQFISGRVLEPSLLTPPPHTEEEAPGAGRGERTGQQPPSPRRRSQMAGCLPPAVSAGWLQACEAFSPCHWASTGPGNSWGRMCRLPESRPAGEESPASLP